MRTGLRSKRTPYPRPAARLGRAGTDVRAQLVHVPASVAVRPPGLIIEPILEARPDALAPARRVVARHRALSCNDSVSPSLESSRAVDPKRAEEFGVRARGE